MNTTSTAQALAMDRLYGSQKRLYDLSRRYYLLGREQMIDRVAVAPGARICDIGAGTAYYLIQLATKKPQGRYYGIDISAEMLSQAKRNLTKAGLDHKITLRRNAAEDLSHRADFGLEEPFDAVLLSYCLSMIPESSVQPAIDAAWRNLAPGGTLYYVDFGPMDAWPTAARKLFSRWLALYHTVYRPKVIEALHQLMPRGNVDLIPLYGGYALMGIVHKSTVE